MTKYQQKVITRLTGLFNDAAKEDDWKGCYEKVSDFLTFQLSRSFWNGVKWERRKSQGLRFKASVASNWPVEVLYFPLFDSIKKITNRQKEDFVPKQVRGYLKDIRKLGGKNKYILSRASIKLFFSNLYDLDADILILR